MNIALILDLIKNLFSNPVTKAAIIGFIVLIWVNFIILVKTYQITRSGRYAWKLTGFMATFLHPELNPKLLFSKREKSKVHSITSQQEKPKTAIKENPPVENKVRLDKDGYLDYGEKGALQ